MQKNVWFKYKKAEAKQFNQKEELFRNERIKRKKTFYVYVYGEWKT